MYKTLHIGINFGCGMRISMIQSPYTTHYSNPLTFFERHTYIRIVLSEIPRERKGERLVVILAWLRGTQVL